MPKPDIIEEDDDKSETYIIEEKTVTEKVVVDGDENKDKTTKSDDDESSDEDSRSDLESSEQDDPDDGASEKTDDKREHRRTERRERRERARRAREFNQTIIREQSDAIKELRARLERVDGRFVKGDVQEAINKRNLAAEKLKNIDSEIATAISAGDGPTSISLIQERDKLNRFVTTVDARLHKFSETLKNREQPKSDDPPAIVKTLASDWMTRHKAWYDPKLGNTDSRIAQTLENEVAEAGYDPGTREYWDELDNRIQKYLPHRVKYDKNDDNDEDDSDDADLPANRSNSRKGPPVASSSKEASAGNSRKVEVTISRERKQALIEAGIWDDPVRRTRMLKQYASYDKNNSSR